MSVWLLQGSSQAFSWCLVSGLAVRAVGPVSTKIQTRWAGALRRNSAAKMKKAHSSEKVQPESSKGSFVDLCHHSLLQRNSTLWLIEVSEVPSISQTSGLTWKLSSEALDLTPCLHESTVLLARWCLSTPESSLQAESCIDLWGRKSWHQNKSPPHKLITYLYGSWRDNHLRTSFTHDSVKSLYFPRHVWSCNVFLPPSHSPYFVFQIFDFFSPKLPTFERDEDRHSWIP